MDITFENVTYIYQPQTPFAYKALDNVSLHIPSGTFVAIIGHTGSGKSTLIQHLNGLIMPSSGKVTIGPFTLTNDRKPKEMKELRRKVGVVFQYPEHQLFEETVAKDISFGPKNFGIPYEVIQKRVQTVTEQVGLSKDILNRSPFDLSGGQMRRVAIAGVLAVNPEILVLDEPTAGLDPRGQKEMMDMFDRMHHDQQLTTILVTHDMEDALKYADYVIILNNGSLYMEGKPEQLFMQNEALRNVQLDIPEVIYFLQQFEETFGQHIPFNGQSIQQIARSIKRIVQGTESS